LSGSALPDDSLLVEPGYDGSADRSATDNDTDDARSFVLGDDPAVDVVIVRAVDAYHAQPTSDALFSPSSLSSSEDEPADPTLESLLADLADDVASV
jgi:hypothetical protein